MLEAILNYFADVAESVDSHFTPHVGEVVFLDRNMLGEVKGIDEATIPRLNRITAADRLHAEEHLVWEGRFWLMGRIGGTDYRWPIVRRRVSVSRAFPHPAIASRVRSDWEASAGLVEPRAVGEVADASDFLGTFVEPQTDFVTGNYPRLKRLIKRHLAAIGQSELPLVTTRGHIADPARSDPHILTASGIYLERHPYDLNRASTLKLWATKRADRSALVPLYVAPRERDEDALQPFQTEDIQSPLPLNAAQEAAVVSARSHPVTVVAGPPGTGKSHLVAATAIDRIAAGQSVLIAAQSIHACNVVHGLLQRYPMVEALRFGDQVSARRLGDMLAAGVPAPDATYDPDRLLTEATSLVSSIDGLRSELARRINDVGGFEQALVRHHDLPLWLAERDLRTIDVDQARLDTGLLRTAGRTRWWARRKAKAQLERTLGRRYDDLAGLQDLLEAIEANQLIDGAGDASQNPDELWNELERLEDRWRHVIGDLLESLRRRRANIGNRAAVQRLASALRLDATSRRAGLAKLDGQFLQAVPLWIGTLDEIESILPIESALFDLVILDEASQISQLAAIPALARGRHAMIVGDSRQLRHTSAISHDAQERAAVERGIPAELAARLDDQTNSMFDATTAVAPVITLEEHYRSAPHIIDFSDRTFYDGQLKLMTQHPRSEAHDAIEVFTVEGHRDHGGVVQAEVVAVVDRIRTLMAQEVRSIGVVSPFEAQAAAIEEATISSFTLEQIEHHHLRVGTVRGFQGSERGHMIISTGIGTDDHAALQEIEDPAIFNVMVTRARTNVDVITTLDRSTAGTGLLGQYLRHADEPPTLRAGRVQASGWTDRIAAEIRDHTEHRVITGYQVAGEHVDIVVGAGLNAFALETEVHRNGPQAHIERHLALRRAGWQIRSFYRSMFYGNEEEAIARLLAELASSV